MGAHPRVREERAGAGDVMERPIYSLMASTVTVMVTSSPT